MNLLPSRRSTGPTILLLERHVLLRASLSAWLSREFSDCSIQAPTSLDINERELADATPKIILVGVELQNANGFSCLRRIRTLLPDASIVALSLQPPGLIHEKAIDSGATTCACIVQPDDRLRDILRGYLAPARVHTP